MPVLVKCSAALLLLLAATTTDAFVQHYMYARQRMCCINGPKNPGRPFHPYQPYEVLDRYSCPIRWTDAWKLHSRTDSFNLHQGSVGWQGSGVPGPMPGRDWYLGATIFTPKTSVYYEILNLQKWVNDRQSQVGLSIYRYLGASGMAVYMCCGDGSTDCKIWNHRDRVRTWVRHSIYCPAGTDKIALVCTKPASMRMAAGCGFSEAFVLAENPNVPYACDQDMNPI